MTFSDCLSRIAGPDEAARAECLRRWSAEMEYSTENVDRLLAELT